MGATGGREALLTVSGVFISYRRGYGGDGGPAVEAGLGKRVLGLAVDGPALEAHLGDGHALAVDGGGNLYPVDAGNQRVRRVDPAGVITTVA